MELVDNLNRMADEAGFGDIQFTTYGGTSCGVRSRSDTSPETPISIRQEDRTEVAIVQIHIGRLTDRLYQDAMGGEHGKCKGLLRQLNELFIHQCEALAEA